MIPYKHPTHCTEVYRKNITGATGYSTVPDRNYMHTAAEFGDGHERAHLYIYIYIVYIHVNKCEDGVMPAVRCRPTGLMHTHTTRIMLNAIYIAEYIKCLNKVSNCWRFVVVVLPRGGFENFFGPRFILGCGIYIKIWAWLHGESLYIYIYILASNTAYYMIIV